MPLGPGDILFVGWDADNEDISFVATTDIAEGELIYFTDDERSETGFFGGEQLFEWTVPAGGVSAGTVVQIDMDPVADTVTFSSGGAVDYIQGGYQIAVSNEMFWAFQGTRVGDDVTPTSFIAVIGNEADGNDNQTPNLAGTGLTTSNGAIIIDGDEDYMEWVADEDLPDPVNRQDLIDSIHDLDNWVTTDGAGNNNPNGTGFNLDVPAVVCFAKETRIATPAGMTRVENLKAGAKVSTVDGQDVAIEWIGYREVCSAELRANPNLYPVRICAGALGQDLPSSDLLVSRQHRIVVNSKIAGRMFGEPQVLVPAIQLTKLPGIYVDETVEQVGYFHILCGSHEILLANGAPAESLYLGQQAKLMMSDEAYEEIKAILPGLIDQADDFPSALPMVPTQRQRTLIERHRKNNKPVLELFEA